MEEQKKTKTIGMDRDTKMVEQKKLTYEQLNDACNQLWQQNQQLAMRNKDMEQFIANKRLDYLFKILESSNMFPSDFVISCSNEIEEAMTIPQNQEEKGK